MSFFVLRSLFKCATAQLEAENKRLKAQMERVEASAKKVGAVEAENTLLWAQVVRVIGDKHRLEARVAGIDAEKREMETAAATTALEVKQLLEGKRTAEGKLSALGRTVSRLREYRRSVMAAVNVGRAYEEESTSDSE